MGKIRLQRKTIKKAGHMKTQEEFFNSAVIVIICMFIGLFLVLWCEFCHAAEIDKNRAVNAIIGEAEGEGYRGMLAVSCAIRNRGTLKGVYGESAPRVKRHKYSVKTFINADRAWEESRNFDKCSFIRGANHWEGTKFPKPSWARNMTETAVIGNQRFYRKD